MLELNWKFLQCYIYILNTIGSHYSGTWGRKVNKNLPQLYALCFTIPTSPGETMAQTASEKSPSDLWSDLRPTSNKRIHALNILKQHYQLGTKCSKSCAHGQRPMSEHVIASRGEVTSVVLCIGLNEKFPIGSAIWILGPELVALFE